LQNITLLNKIKYTCSFAAESFEDTIQRENEKTRVMSLRTQKQETYSYIFLSKERKRI